MSVAMRDAFGKKLVEAGAANKDLVVIDADVSSSTRTTYFAKAYPGRFFNCGVAEGNLAGMAAGLATAGFHPVINAFAIFLCLKSLDQIRNDICYNSLPVVIAGAYGGYSDSFDGASHESLEDIAIFRSLPNMQVIVPSDAAQAEAALEYALKQDGPVYIRLNRNAVPECPKALDFENGEPILCRRGKDVAIAANGTTVSYALDAARMLEAEGIQAAVYSVPFVKPLNGEAISSIALETGNLLTVEEHNVIGGFSGAICEHFLRNGICVKFDSLGAPDAFGESGPYEPLLAKYGISGENIAKHAKALIRG